VQPSHPIPHLKSPPAAPMNQSHWSALPGYIPEIQSKPKTIPCLEHVTVAAGVVVVDDNLLIHFLSSRLAQVIDKLADRPDCIVVLVGKVKVADRVDCIAVLVDKEQVDKEHIEVGVDKGQAADKMLVADRVDYIAVLVDKEQVDKEHIGVGVDKGQDSGEQYKGYIVADELVADKLVVDRVDYIVVESVADKLVADRVDYIAIVELAEQVEVYHGLFQKVVVQ
jgi:hypothetical protein